MILKKNIEKKLEAGKRYWFCTGNDKYPVVSGLFTGKYTALSNLAILRCKNNDEWHIVPSRLWLTEDEAIKWIGKY